MDHDPESFEGGLALNLIVGTLIVARVGAETEGVFDNGVHRVGGQSKFGPVQVMSWMNADFQNRLLLLTLE